MHGIIEEDDSSNCNGTVAALDVSYLTAVVHALWWQINSETMSLLLFFLNLVIPACFKVTVVTVKKNRNSRLVASHSLSISRGVSFCFCQRCGDRRVRYVGTWGGSDWQYIHPGVCGGDYPALVLKWRVCFLPLALFALLVS